MTVEPRNSPSSFDIDAPADDGDPPRFDVLRLPVIGGFLRWRWARAAMQAPLLLVSMVMVAHAFFGPDLAPKNLATLLTWVHFRGLVVLMLLFGGNFFCMACPFMLPRQLAKWLGFARWHWPRRLRHKGLAITLFIGVLFVYEWRALWSDPWATGLLIVGYFATAFLVDAFFKKASFCKYVCPVGQFNFLASTVSPLEIAVRDPDACNHCRTKDCIAGRRAVGAALRRDSESDPTVGAGLPRDPDQDQSAMPLEQNRGVNPPLHRGVPAMTQPARLKTVQRGCELELFLPQKIGNLDCTFCLDCVHACPHDNIGLMARIPGEELAAPAVRSGIGDIDRRKDWTMLIVVFVFGAVLNAFAMISPVYAFEQSIARATGIFSRLPVLAVLFTIALVVEPAILFGGAAWVTRRAAPAATSLWTIINRFSRSLVPLGFGVWLAHYGFHFFTGALTVIPVTQNAVQLATGHDLLGAPLWQLGGLPQAYVYPLELGFITVGMVAALVVGWRIASDFAPAQKVRAFLPWAFVIVLLFATACWTMSQPMDMRGTFVAA